MSRLRKSLARIDILSDNDYLEPSEQDELIQLFNDVSYERNQWFLRFFTWVFLATTPLFTVLRFFKSQPIFGLVGMLIVILSAANLFYFNHYKMTQVAMNSNGVWQFQALAAQSPRGFTIFRILEALLAILYVVIFYRLDNLTKFKPDWDTWIFVHVPLYTMGSSLIINSWIASYSQEVRNLSNFKYDKKVV